MIVRAHTHTQTCVHAQTHTWTTCKIPHRRRHVSLWWFSIWSFSTVVVFTPHAPKSVSLVDKACVWCSSWKTSVWCRQSGSVYTHGYTTDFPARLRECARLCACVHVCGSGYISCNRYTCWPLFTWYSCWFQCAPPHGSSFSSSASEQC